MSHRFIKDLKPGERIEDDVFLVRQKDLRTTSNGNLYIHLILVDRTGEMLTRVWQATEAMYARLEEGGFTRFKGRTESFKGALQFIVEGMREAEWGSFSVGDYVPHTKHDIDAMFARVKEILGGIKNEDLKAICDAFLSDDELMGRFRKAPAAAVLHHAYLGGLLEHTLALLELGLVVIPRYPRLSLDLVLAGLFLHDLGKSAELCYDTALGYTDPGQLIGHITQGVVWIEKKSDVAAETLGRPVHPQVRWMLDHIVLSHHGRYEFGSPKLPALPEAVAIHHLDNLDAKVHQFLAAIDNDLDAEATWTNYNRALETKVFKADPFDVRGNDDLPLK